MKALVDGVCGLFMQHVLKVYRDSYSLSHLGSSRDWSGVIMALAYLSRLCQTRVDSPRYLDKVILKQSK